VEAPLPKIESAGARALSGGVLAVAEHAASAVPTPPPMEEAARYTSGTETSMLSKNPEAILDGSTGMTHASSAIPSAGMDTETP
jgi:hypothetical protein